MIELLDAWLHRPHLIAFVILLLWGLYITVTHHNLVKKLIGLYLVQTSVIFFLSPPARRKARRFRSCWRTAKSIQRDAYVNPATY